MSKNSILGETEDRRLALHLLPLPGIWVSLGSSIGLVCEIRDVAMLHSAQFLGSSPACLHPSLPPCLTICGFMFIIRIQSKSWTVLEEVISVSRQTTDSICQSKSPNEKLYECWFYGNKARTQSRFSTQTFADLLPSCTLGQVSRKEDIFF